VEPIDDDDPAVSDRHPVLRPRAPKSVVCMPSPEARVERAVGAVAGERDTGFDAADDDDLAVRLSATAFATRQQVSKSVV
jgi:hypothetical protein